MNKNNLFTQASTRNDYIKGKGGMGNQAMTDSINSAFSTADRAGMDFMSNYFKQDDLDTGNLDWDLFNEGFGAAKSGAWDDYWDGLDKTENDFDFSAFSTPSWNMTSTGYNAGADRSKLDDFTADKGIDSEGNLNAPAPWQAQEAGNWETLTDSWNQLQQTLRNRQNTFDDKYQDTETLATGLQSVFPQYQSAMESSSEKLRQAQLANASSRYQAIDDILRGDTLAGQRATEQGTTGSTNRLLLGAKARAAQDRSGIEEAANLEAAQRQYSLEGQVAGAKKAIEDEKLANQFRLREAFATGREEAHDAFAATVGSTREETEHLITLAEEWVEHQVEVGNMEVKSALEARTGILTSLAEAAKLGGAEFDKMIDDMLRDLTQIGEEDQALRSEAEVQIGNLPWIESVLKEVLTQDELLGMGESDIAAMGQFLTDLVNITGGNPAWLTNPALAEEATTALEAILPETVGGGSDPGVESSNTVQRIYDSILKNIGGGHMILNNQQGEDPNASTDGKTLG